MISFIVIGRNEGWKLTKCLQSIFNTIHYNDLNQYEILYVDSKSTDDSIKRVANFPKVKIFSITGNYNSAIARNIGAKESKGDALFFIDGDMEIQEDFLPFVYSKNVGLMYDFVTGQCIDYSYNYSGKLLFKETYNKLDFIDEQKSTVGGLFLIKRDLWFYVGGMKNKMQKSQDIDLAFRLAKQGFYLMKKNNLLAIHHTVAYYDKQRMWKMLLKGNHFFRVVLLRENISNKYAWKYFMKGNSTLIALLVLIILTVLTNNPYLLLLFFLLIAVKTILGKTFRRQFNLGLILSNFAHTPLCDISLLFAFFLYWPLDHIEEYKKVV